MDIGIDNLSHNLHKQGWNIEYVELEQEPTAYQHLMKQIHNVSPSIIVLASYFAEDIVHFHQAFIENPTNAIIYSIYAPSAFFATRTTLRRSIVEYQ